MRLRDAKVARKSSKLAKPSFIQWNWLSARISQPAALEQGDLLGQDEGGVGRGQAVRIDHLLGRRDQGRRQRGSRASSRRPGTGVNGTAIWSLG